MRKLFRFSTSPEFDEEHLVAQAVFWADCLDGIPDDAAQDALASKESEAAYHEWFAFDFDLQSGRTPIDLFLEREGRRLSVGEREYLARMRGSHLRLYEVAEVRLDEGLDLVDVWTDERVSVCERRATRQAVQWDLIAARVVQGSVGEPVLDGFIYLYPAMAKEEIVRDFRREHRAFRRKVPQADLLTFFKRCGMLFHHFWLDHVALRPPPTIVTAEGEEVVFAKVVFDVRDRQALETALTSHPDLGRQIDGSYVWLQEGSQPRRSLGTLARAGDRLVFETTSRRRAERGRAMVEALVGDAVRFRATRYEDIAEAVKKAPPASEARSSPIPPEIEARIVAEFYEKHYRKWVDQPIPALGNRTPRHAARLKSMRPKLVALLKGMETMSARNRREGRFAYDFGWIWAEVGLKRPE
jgi:hypothetical protein